MSHTVHVVIVISSLNALRLSECCFCNNTVFVCASVCVFSSTLIRKDGVETSVQKWSGRIGRSTSAFGGESGNVALFARPSESCQRSFFLFYF